ncbi:ATP-binding protein [Marinobacter sp. HL-58]|uniref:sensor histidine kinase n=1 Tax=Marinobacter sp. HL-58 TaxID=1479237 RepID=UPI000485304D|nr:ATP-binding protein [Marinobacter sp. HL-58]KPP97937.1 MAG: PAS/PAC sensor signal transduction histidine kinase [Marinobacter sp. HL-58]
MTIISTVPVFQLPECDPEAGLVLGPDSTILASNPAAKMLAREAGTEEIAGLLPINTQALINASVSQGRAIEGVECHLPGIALLWTFIPDRASGQVLARGRNATDELRKLNEATRCSRLYRLITENTTDLISRHAPDGRFIDATPASWRLLGYWPEELRGKPLEDVFRSSSIHDELEEARNRLRDEGYATLTLEITHRDGSRRWFEIASRAIRETYTGAVIEVVSVSRDITARVESEENNRRLADELAHTARLATLGELASSIAHEMNQPLATIVNFASASQRYLKQAQEHPECLERVDDGLQRITHHANRASEVIRRLRAFLSKGQKRTAPISINDTVTNVRRLCQWDADKNNVVIRTRLAESNPVITADPVLLEQVLINLVRNGIDANLEARGGNDTASRITLTTCVTPERETLIEVTDQGTGLDNEGLRQMFTPFYTSKPQGLGLGLSMSRSIIEGFGGFLDAKPAEGSGLVLVCRFPPALSRTNTPDDPRGDTPE